MNPADVEAVRKGAPERIWAFYAPEIADDNDGATIVAHEAVQHGAAPYIRADLHTARIAALEARVMELEEGLRPFSREHAWGPETRFEIVVAGQMGSITGADLDRARALIGEKP